MKRIIEKICPTCKRKFTKHPHYSYGQWATRTYCSLSCKGKAMKPKNLVHWKGGKYKSGGYWLIYCPNHPRAIKNHVKRAILVAEKTLGRSLAVNEIVHHINGIKDDDKPNNLSVIDNGEHSKIHALQSKLGCDKKHYRQRDSLGRFI